MAYDPGLWEHESTNADTSACAFLTLENIG